MRRAWWVGRLAASVGAVALITVVYSRAFPVNPTTVALSYVAVILLVATGWGIAEATVASLAAAVCFNFFFLPPIGQLTIADPQNWIALLAFLLTAVVASQLSGRARQRNIEALARQRDLERLYAVSRALLLSENAISTTLTIAQRIANAFELPAVALYNAETDTVSLGGGGELTNIDTRLRESARQSISFHDASGVIVTPIRLGGAPIGSLALSSGGLSDTVLQSIANLAAIALERARGQEAAMRAEAARQSGELRATVLDALAHEFKTPLTSMKAASSDLRAASLSDRDRELVAIIDEDLGRLDGLVTDVVRMLRIDGGDFAVHRSRHRLAEIVLATVEQLGPRLNGHEVVNRVPDELLVTADGELLGLALRQLFDNAVKYSSPSSTIDIGARSNGGVSITIRNTGSVISEREQARIFERFYRGAASRHVPGTGMGLSIVQRIAQAHGGSLVVSSTADAGTEFTLSLPEPPTAS